MIISVILDTEYMGVAERNKWFLKCVSHAMKEDVLIITHSYFRDHLKEVVEGCSDRFYCEFEMDKVSVRDIEKLDICYIPDEIFENIYEQCGSRSKQLNYLYNNSVPEIEKIIIEFVDKALEKRRQSSPKFILNSLHVFEFVRVLSSFWNCPIIPWVFSAIRKVHGYNQTLYMTHVDDNLFNSLACKRMYDSRVSDNLGFRILNKKEILALLGKKHNLYLLPLMDRLGKYEVGVIGGGFHITPEIYQKDNVTDDDIYYECKKQFESNQVITRTHPMQLDQIGIGRSHMKNDPAAFILSCNRVVTIQSQMIIKAAMWNRAAITMSDALPYSYLLQGKIDKTQPINDYDLNFILFAYFVPDACMFNTEYWLWRLSEPSVRDIALRHVKTICTDLDLKEDILAAEDDRFNKLLEFRTGSDQIKKIILDTTEVANVSYEFPLSCIKCYLKNGNIIFAYTLNYREGDRIVTQGCLPDYCVKFDFIPQNDVDGYVKIYSVSMGNRTYLENIQEKYYSKNQSVICVETDFICGCYFKVAFGIRPYN